MRAAARSAPFIAPLVNRRTAALRGWYRFPDVPQQAIEITENNLEKIVEIMRDAA